MSPFHMYLATAMLALGFAAHLWLAPPPVPVLLIHDVNKDRPGYDFWTLHPDRFRALVDLIDRLGLKGISLDEARRHVDGRLAASRAREAVLITVDDGCVSSATVIAPELARRGHAASFFVVANWGPPDYLTKDQVRALAASGHDVGSHSLTHTSLNVQAKRHQQAEEARIATELKVSRAKTEEMTGRPVLAFAYPKGDWDATTARLAREAGYALAFTTDTGYLEPGGEPMESPRMQLNWDTPLEWVEKYLTAPRRERERNLLLVSAIAALALAAAWVARPRRD